MDSTTQDREIRADVASLVRRVRSESGLSQRALAELAGTSGPTIAAYEGGSKEPRLSTLQRLAAGADRAIQVRLVPAGLGASQRARRERRSLALAAATAGAIAQDFPAAKKLALANLARAEGTVGDNAARKWLTAWRRILDEGPRAVRSALLDPSEHGHDMRQMTPFAGLLSEDARRSALAAADAFDLLPGVA